MGKPPKLELITLGGLTILPDGEPIQGLASRKAEALLVYLAVTGRPHAREHLATMLWDDRPLGRSLANLSVLLNSLKKQLEPFLQIERQTIAISSEDRISVDLRELQEAAESWDAASQVGDGSGRRDLGYLEDALSTYKGDFLQGFHLREARGFDEWASVQREQTQRQVLAGQQWLAEAYQRQGDLGASIRCLRKALVIDPLQEELQRILMRILALSNRYSEALGQYRACAEVLRVELEVEPSRATRQLYDRILARREHATDNLPAQTSEIIGRDPELVEIFLRMSEPGIRLLTLIGAGGIGKTRLALEAARRLKSIFLEGVWIVDLAPIDDPGLVPLAIGRVFSMPESMPASQVANPKEALVERLLQFMADKQLCLILDNCEHLLDSTARIVDRLLQRCPELKVLVTTRERLDITLEHIFVVDPLAVPSIDQENMMNLEYLRGNDSIRLFVERAQAVREGFRLSMENHPVLVRICRALDGMPLAIEIAASRLRSVSLSEMAEHLEESIRDLGREHAGALPRHQTIEAAIDWSYQLLGEDEKRLFKITTIFRGGFDFMALAAVASAVDLNEQAITGKLAQLVEKSLITLRGNGHPSSRYILLEPVRQFGIKRIEADPFLETILEAHACYYLQLSETLAPDLHGPGRKDKVALLEIDADNLRAAHRYYLAAEDRASCLRFAYALWEGFWLNQGYFSEGRDWIDRIIVVCGESRESAYGVLILARGAFAWTLGDLDTAMDCFLQAQSIAEEHDDKHLIQWTMYWQAFVLSDRSQFTRAEACLTRGLRLAVEAGAKRGEGWQIYCQAHIARVTGKNREAVQLFQQALEILAEEDIFGAGWCYIYLGHLAIEERDLDRARHFLLESHQIYGELDNLRGKGGSERGLGVVELEAGNFELAEEHLKRSRQLFEQLGWVKMASSSEIYLGYLATIKGRPEEAEELLLDSLEYQRRESDLYSIAHGLFVLGLLATRKDELEQALELLDAAEILGQELDVAFPHHLVSAVEDARKGLQGRGVKLLMPARSANELVDLILLNPDSWLANLSSTSKLIS